MNRSFMLEGSRKQLINQLVYFDEEKIAFLNTYFPAQDLKRSIVEGMITTYITAVEAILENFNYDILHSRALIGSKLSVRYMEDQSTETFTIVFPHLADPDQNKISFISPMGYQLLLSQANEICKLEYPSSVERVEVLKIQFINCGEY
ncbi:GreA/GreB family elongation factor [Paenibacillus turpanensis]|uniref:GreA/GreB family elongation factor n=1 Tax=Paenibacillus turpanensis TaxID=2689078 RepID=UPI00140A6548|nr:GreA/GreB family elongation factor [Paenibacillus turpanensis]